MSNYLDIIHYSEEMVQHTCYYFRLDSVCKLNERTVSITEDEPLVIPPHGYVLVKSRETFHLSEKVLGIFGQVSSLTSAGLSLNNSPFIDPLFEGQLDLGIFNNLNKPVSLNYLQKIGKVSFFDVSDTYPVKLEDHLIIKETFEKRKPDYDDHPVPGWQDYKK